ncbi:Nn.00g102980.m01.CDS01 [Neocucurbitaria sp. VM-36]
MEDQTRPSEASQAASWGGSAEAPGLSADHAFEQQEDVLAEEHAGTLWPKSGGHDDNISSDKAVIFRNHHGDRYIWPFELCTSFNAIKPLLEEVYTLLHQQDFVDDIKQGRYEIQTDDGDTILPSVWTAIVKPSSTIQICFTSNSLRRRRQSTHDSDSVVNTIHRSGDQGSSHEDTRATFNADNFEPPPSDSEGPYSDGDEGEDDSEAQLSPEDEYEASEQADLPSPVRDSASPLDTEGNKLSFGVDTSCPKPNQPSKDAGNNNGDSKVLSSQKDASDTYVETLRITKATSAVVESRSTIQVYTLPSTEKFHLQESPNMTWYHIPASRLDYSRFRDVCLAVPSLSDRLHTLIRETFKAIEKDKIKAFLDGIFIEPGTVIRADERSQAEPQSVIFSCIPYFDLQPPARKLSTGLGDRLSPPRTLMQSYYPYEPVRERDAEQAYRKFGNDRSGNIINVPNMWMMNIGTNIVVTSGHKPLSQELIKSIEILRENLEQVGIKDISKDPLTKIRLTDWDGRVLLFPLEACRSYLQMEQRIRELKRAVHRGMGCRSLRLAQRTSGGEKRIVVKDWRDIVRRTDLIFIDLALVGEGKVKEPQHGFLKKDISNLLKPTSTTLVPPFFLWPYTYPSGMNNDSKTTPISIPSKVNRSLYCLEHAEKSMRSETLDAYDTVNAVDKTFTSTTFYRSLPENTHDGVLAEFSSLRHNPIRLEGAASSHTHHQTIISTQCTTIVERSFRFFEIVRATFKLFVDDVDKSTLLRKAWGAIANIPKLAAAIEDRGALDSNPNEHSDPSWKPPLMGESAWFIRNDVKDRFIPTPEADDKFKRSVQRCKRCQSFEPFESLEAARGHLQRHLRPDFQSEHVKTAATSTSLPKSSQSQYDSARKPNLDDWVVSYEQVKREETNAGALAILTQACETATSLYTQSKELADGVQNEDGTMSDLYSLPRQLVEAFRGIIVFYLAIERALHHTEESYQKDDPLEATYDPSYRPFSEEGLKVLKRFGEGARRSLMMARAELCGMVASIAPFDILDHLSLGPEYVCAWLMRRLLVKPLQQHMTVGDMYREYLSTIQFQVNHRPGKRLLRSINLLQEELQVLSEVNSWQTKLIQNYIRVLDDTTYEKDIASRRVMFPYERVLLRSCLENLALTSEEYSELLRRCGPLSDSTKQSLEINEEDHGKAIMVFTTVTVIFLPLSFVTSYLGMNTSDIRDMDKQQSLFWIIALPLTLVTMGTCMIIGYNGDELRDTISSIYRMLTGKQDRSTSARGISVAQRKRAGQLRSASSSALDTNTFADDAEYASPRPEHGIDEYGRKALMVTQNSQTFSASYPVEMVEPISLETRMAVPQTKYQTQSYAEPISLAPMESEPSPTYTRIDKHYLDAASIRFYGYPYETDPMDSSVFLIKQELNDWETRMLMEHTERRRHGRDGMRSGLEERGHDLTRVSGRSKVVQYAIPPSRVRFSSVLGGGNDFEDGDVDGGGARVQEYTWHRKRGYEGPRRMGRDASGRKRMWRGERGRAADGYS